MRVRAAPWFSVFALVMLASPARPSGCDGVWHDATRNRDVPVRIDLPRGKGKVPAVLWSPGLGGSTGNAGRWVQAWNAGGIAAIRIQHPGSDAAVYARDGTPTERAARLRAGYSPPQLLARIADIGFVADELARTPPSSRCDLGRIDRDQLGLAGHSMGGWVVQAMAGQRATIGGEPGDTMPALDRRFRAFIAMSTTGAADPALAERQFSGIGRPLLVVTGTNDGVPAGAAPEIAAREIAQRSAPYVGAPADGRKALLVLAGAEHMVFAGDMRPLPAETAMQDRVGTITTAWWRRWLAGNAAADAVLAQPALAAGDVWARK